MTESTNPQLPTNTDNLAEVLSYLTTLVNDPDLGLAEIATPLDDPAPSHAPVDDSADETKPVSEPVSHNSWNPQALFALDEVTIVEQKALMLLEHLPGAEVERTRDLIQINYNGTEGIVLFVTPEALELRLPTVEWTAGSYAPKPSSKLWKRLQWNQVWANELPDLLQATLTARRREFRNCRYCHKPFAIEHMFSKTACHSCASLHEGVMF
ncbi:hypothetical protein [Pantanalinema sp. GBBB05]|uniref:hypothetical protein n=1 Tax=Pantanalinema sp. GBBB05 TaxID=2604139 RepID=UPI001DA2784A|nr:hypothetical protein [Pantanalinema sp. GBBB05]